MTGQLGPLVALRWRMVRSRRSRRGFLVLASLAPVLCIVAAVVGATASRDRVFDVLLLAPTAYLSVAVLAVLAPLVAGGGNELFPPEQLVAYPVTARTQFAASLVLTPLNLAWTTQLIGLVGLTTFVSNRAPAAVLSVATCLVYVVVVTLAGQALGWFVVGLRQRPWGRTVTWSAAAAVTAAGLVVTVAGKATQVLDGSPTTWVVVGAVNGSAGAYRSWVTVTVPLLVLCVAFFHVGRAACGWAMRRPGRSTGTVETRPVHRRPTARGPLTALLAVDRASVWRSPSLRRGLLVLGILPGVVAATAGLDWASLVLLPGLVAAGAGLLFGVNAFCLDGTGAVWLASLPGDPVATYRAKAQVTTEVAVVAVLLAVAAGASRSGRLPDAAQLSALLGCALVSIARVVATCMRLSLTRPHRADLRSPRDTPAPPGVMAAYSVRLAVSTTLVAVLFSGLAEVGDWRLPTMLAAAFLLLSARRLTQSAGMWQLATVRSHVVTTVASG